MRIKYSKKYLLLLLCIALGTPAHTKPLIHKKGSIPKLRKTYLRVLKKFDKEICRRGDRETFDRLLKDYRADGHYIPYDTNGMVDLNAIKTNLPLLKKKLKWINKQIKNFPSANDFLHYKKNITKVEKSIDDILDHYKQIFINQKLNEKDNGNLEKLVKQLKKNYTQLTQSIPYLLNFSYPVDHLDNRKRYEESKQVNSKLDSNILFLKRKLLEDGAYDPNHSRPDFYLRTTLDTIGLYFKNSPKTIKEEIRYDLEWSIRNINRLLKHGREHQLSRLKEWQTRTHEALNFYTDLVDSKSSQKVKDIAKHKNEATKKLKDFIYLKQAKTFQFFSHYKPYIRALFVMDQILLHEVGNATGENYRDRRDVAQVVINRHDDPGYSRIEKKDRIFQSLKQKTSFKSAKAHHYPWLNTLFKEGEFSFTYYYFPSSLYIFCPDFYFQARKTRFKNIALAIDILRNPNSDFKALRYYSRVSMIGKIDVQHIWPEAELIPERPGKKIVHTTYLTQKVLDNKFRYFYTFNDPNKRKFHVLEVNNEKYAVTGYPKNMQFYHYRDPNKFTFFR